MRRWLSKSIPIIRKETTLTECCPINCVASIHSLLSVDINVKVTYILPTQDNHKRAFFAKPHLDMLLRLALFTNTSTINIIINTVDYLSPLLLGYCLFNYINCITLVARAIDLGRIEHSIPKRSERTLIYDYPEYSKNSGLVCMYDIKQPYMEDPCYASREAYFQTRVSMFKLIDPF